MLKHIFTAVLAFATIMPALHLLWNEASIQSPALTWAYTVTTGFLIIYMGLAYCGYRHQILTDRIQKCAAAKTKLEMAVIKNRRSSKKRGR